MRAARAAAAALALAGCAAPGPQVGNGEVGGGVGLLFGGADRRGTMLAEGFEPLDAGRRGDYLRQVADDLTADVVGVGAAVENSGAQVVVTLPTPALFAHDSAEIFGGQSPVIADIARTLRRNRSAYVDIVASDPWGGDRRLARLRAEAVADLLVEEGVSPARIAAIGYAPAGLRATAPDDGVEIVVTPLM